MSKCFNVISNQRYHWLNSFVRYNLYKSFVPCILCRYVTHESHHKYDGRDLYALLKVSPRATQKQIKTAYYRLSLIHHPDKNKESPKAHETFTQLTEAYKILGSVHSRRNYDRSRKIHIKSTIRDAKFHEREVVAHSPITSRRYDTWTQTHYNNALKLRDERIKRDRLRNEESKEENEALRSRYSIIAACVFLVMPFYFFKKLITKRKPRT